MSALDAQLAAMLRALPDAVLVEAAAKWLGDRFVEICASTRAVGLAGAEPLAAPPPTWTPPPAVVPAARCGRPSASVTGKPARCCAQPDRDAVFKALAASAEPMSTRDLVAVTGIARLQVLSACKILRSQGRVALGGHSTGSVWGLAL